MSENDKIMLFQPRQLQFLNVRASCGTGWKWTGLFRRVAPSSPDLNPLDYHVWGAMLGKVP